MESTEKVDGGQVVLGVKLARVDEAIFRESYAKVFGKPPKKSQPLEASVGELAAKFIEDNRAKKGEKLLECDACLGGSPKSFDACPFCGTGDEEEVAAEDLDEAPPKAAAAPPPPASSKKAVAKAEKAEKNGRRKLVEEQPATTAIVKANGNNGVAKHGPPGTEADLDAALGRIRKIHATSARELWQMGQELLEIYDRELWRQRNENGAPKYKTFEQFVTAEVDLSTKTVFRMMHISKEFTEQQLAQYGTSILRGILSAPKEARAELIEKIDRGEITSSRGAAAEAKRIREAAGVTHVPGVGKGKGRGKGAAAATAAAVKKRAERPTTVTVPFPEGKKFLPAFAKPASKKAEPKRAKRVSDQPWAKLECSNGVSVYVALVDKGGQLGFVVEARREE